MTIDPPVCDDMFEVLESDSHREYSELVVSLMEVWSVSMPEAEKRMENYSLKQCETIIKERWTV